VCGCRLELQSVGLRVRQSTLLLANFRPSFGPSRSLVSRSCNFPRTDSLHSNFSRS
jgi:hypothetical protein